MLAPEATPMRSGEASGFRKTVWNTEPDRLNPNPAAAAMNVRGRRRVKKTLRAVGLTALPDTSPISSVSGIG